jgi:uncharacterized repeat protein (TIGR03803 family)
MDGEYPLAGLIQGTDGNFYGTTQEGGDFNNGAVFKITPQGNVTSLYSFCMYNDCIDGEYPYAALVQATDGNFYGTTFQGGPPNNGTIFKITPQGTLTTLYTFCSQRNCTDGETPEYGSLVQGRDGNLYGTTLNGGAFGYGTVFKITPSGVLTVLYSFCYQAQSGCPDGANPSSGLVQGTDGNFYGTTRSGGVIGGVIYDDGTVFKVSPQGSLTTLHTFDYDDGYAPWAGLLQASDGNFYGTTWYGGANGEGTIFKITPAGVLTKLYDFCESANCPDGQYPCGTLAQGMNGVLYGTALEGGSFAYGTAYSLNVGLWNFSALAEQADYLGENKTDFTVWRPSNGTFYSSDGSTPPKSLTRQWGIPSDVPVIGDFDGDRKSDVAVWRPSSGTWYVMQSRTGNTLQQPWGVTGDKPVPGDYDGDGKTDFAVWRPSTGTWYLLQSTAGTLTEQWGMKGDIPVPGDYDGDGKTDVAIWRPSTGTWYALLSGNHGSLLQKQFGIAGDIPVPGDYDGDGKTDIAVWRPSAGTWYVIQSSTGNVVTEKWGTNGDVPVPRDYDGDGKTDFAVWRPSTGTWYVIKSSTNQMFSLVWGANKDIPVNKPVGQ